jgi:glycosyltransferase involved in cell wall biosynthesis
MKKPFFTVITVSYNSSKYIRDAIESVLASTFEDFEYIIGDDCSTDNTWEIIQDYNDPRIVKYRNEINLREYPNRNKAISMAKGEWILFIDGDDVIYPHSLGVLENIFSTFNGFAIAIMCPENKDYIAPLMLNPEQLYEIEFSEFGLINRALSHTVYRSSILKENLFEVAGFIGLDTLNRLQILMKEKCLLIQDNLTWWRRTSTQASAQLEFSLKNEMFVMSKILFKKSECPLSESQKEVYIINSKVKLIRNFTKLILKLQFSNAYTILAVNDLRFIDFKYILYPISCINPMHKIDESIRFSIK